MSINYFKVHEGLELFDGTKSLYQGSGEPSSTVPRDLSLLTNGDFYCDIETQLYYKYNSSTLSWEEAGLSNIIGTGDFDDTNYLEEVDGDGVYTLTSAIKDLDSQILSNKQSITVATSVSNPKGYAFAMTDDSDTFGIDMTSPTAANTIPSDLDDTVQYFDELEDGDILFCTEGTAWIYDEAATTWVKDISLTAQEKDMWAVKFDLTSPTNREVTALYFYSSKFIKCGEIANDTAIAVTFTDAYTTTNLDVLSSSDNVQSAIGKLDGRLGTLTSTNVYNITNLSSLTNQMAEIDTAIGNRSYAAPLNIAADQSLASSVSILDNALGDTSNYATSPNIISNNDSVAAAIGKLDQSSGFSASNAGANTNSAIVSATKERSSSDNAIAIKWFVTCITTAGAIHSTEILAIYPAGTTNSNIQYTNYGVVTSGAFTSGPTITPMYNEGMAKIEVEAAHSGSTVHISIKGMVIGEYDNATDA